MNEKWMRNGSEMEAKWKQNGSKMEDEHLIDDLRGQIQPTLHCQDRTVVLFFYSSLV